MRRRAPRPEGARPDGGRGRSSRSPRAAPEMSAPVRRPGARRQACRRCGCGQGRNGRRAASTPGLERLGEARYDAVVAPLGDVRDREQGRRGRSRRRGSALAASLASGCVTESGGQELVGAESRRRDRLVDQPVADHPGRERRQLARRRSIPNPTCRWSSNSGRYASSEAFASRGWRSGLSRSRSCRLRSGSFSVSA